MENLPSKHDVGVKIDKKNGKNLQSLLVASLSTCEVLLCENSCGTRCIKDRY